MASESKSRRADNAKANAAAKRPAGRGRPASRGLLNMDAEQSARAMLVGGVTLIVVIALGFIAFGYWYSVVRPRNRTVLEVDGTKISYNAMKRRMTYELFQNVSLQQQPRALPELTYQTLLEELTLISRAESDLGIVATPDELDKKLRSKIGAGPEADQKQFADALLRQLNISGLHEDEYRRVAKAELLTTKIKDKFKLEAPLTVTQAKVEVIAVNTEEDATKAAARVKAGEDWATVAKDVSQEVDVQTTGGVHDYTPQGAFNPAYDSYIFDATTAIGVVSAPLPASGNTQFFLVRVDDRADKPVTEEQKPKLADKQYHDWLVAQQDKMTVVRNWNAQDQADALTSVANASASKLRQQQPPQQQAPAQAPPVQPAAPVDQNPPAPNAPVAPGSGNGQ